MEPYQDSSLMTSSEKQEKFVYHFSEKKHQNPGDLIHLLGGKGAHLSEMTAIGLPVPPGFTITSNMSLYFYKNNQTLPPSFKKRIKQDIQILEKKTSRQFGSHQNTLLLSVRSGSKVSMPGMMDTILNLGLTYDIAKSMAQENPKLAWDCYRRLVQMYGDVVLKADASMFIFLIEDYKSKKNYKSDSDLTAQDLEKLSIQFKEQILQTTGQEFPEDPETQLFESMAAVFKSWNNPRAATYRKLHNYPDDIGTAVNVQSMVFGNRGKNSATGVVFSRNPSTGEQGIFGEFLPEAQGEDVVAGLHTPFPISKSAQSLETLMPKVYKKLVSISSKLEKHFKDMQDIEFTIEEGELWILQTRQAKRSIQASIRSCVDFVKEGLITPEEAIMKIRVKDFESLLHRKLDPKVKKKSLCRGLPASPGSATGKIVFSPARAQQIPEETILFRNETSPEDIQGMIASSGIVTTRGGMTSHAAVVARGMGKCCIVGCHHLVIDFENKKCQIGDTLLKEGDQITIDGSSGKIYQGEIPTIPPQLDQYFYQFMEMVNRHSSMKVMANADTPEDAKIAQDFGAQGIGLCRTEHMFFKEDRLDTVRKLILFQDDLQKRKTFLDDLLEKQTEDFFKIFQVMEGQKIRIRLLDPPLHEFLPSTETEIRQLAKKWSENEEDLIEKIEALKELNPMLGHRGCRLAVTFPELYKYQSLAVAQAQIRMIENNKKCQPEIMIPLVGSLKEFTFVKNIVEEACAQIQKKKNVPLSIPIGTMIELPASTLVADQIAEEASFFSIGSNDLTQSTLGISRDDCGRFLPTYIEEKIIDEDPFVRIDEKSVGYLIARACQLARSVKNNFPISLCGEHGAHPESISFLSKIGLNSVSCSPYRISVARLSVAQACIRQKSQNKA